MHDHDNELDGALRAGLRGLRIDTPPARDLWPDIAARIAEPPRATTPRPTGLAASRMAPWALAASVVIAVLLLWQHGALAPRSPSDRLIAREAQAMTREYQGALRVITASVPDRRVESADLRELDRSAAQIRGALLRDPNARFLLDRLQHTYALRLALTQREAMS
jgi:hypothetical protein